jgi:hypothetical protein
VFTSCSTLLLHQGRLSVLQANESRFSVTHSLGYRAHLQIKDVAIEMRRVEVHPTSALPSIFPCAFYCQRPICCSSGIELASKKGESGHQTRISQPNQSGSGALSHGTLELGALPLDHIPLFAWFVDIITYLVLYGADTLLGQHIVMGKGEF